MLHLEGMPISPGNARGIAVVYDYEIERRFELPHRSISHREVESEYTRLNDALGQFRTFDLGGDKLPPFLLSGGSKSSASLHLRGLRFLLSERSLLDTQLRAILHVAQTADIRILFPMVIGSDDFPQPGYWLNGMDARSGSLASFSDGRIRHRRPSDRGDRRSLLDHLRRRVSTWRGDDAGVDA